MARADYSRDFRSISKGEAKRKELAPVLRPSSVTQRKTEYSGPVKNREEDARGNANVSREELADFQRQYGADMTLRDLLNADKTGKLPARVGAGAGRGAAEGRKATDRDTAPLRADTGPAIPRRDKAAEAKGSETLERMKARAERDPGRLKAAGLAPDSTTLEQSLVAAAGMAAPKGAQMLGRGLLSVLERRAAAEGAKRVAKEASRRDPEMEVPAQGGVFRSARPDAEAAKQAEYMRRVEELGLKKGGTTKAYAKGGSVRGAGCETRSKKTRYI